MDGLKQKPMAGLPSNRVIWGYLPCGGKEVSTNTLGLNITFHLKWEINEEEIVFYQASMDSIYRNILNIERVSTSKSKSLPYRPRV